MGNSVKCCTDRSGPDGSKSPRGSRSPRGPLSPREKERDNECCVNAPWSSRKKPHQHQGKDHRTSGNVGHRKVGEYRPSYKSHNLPHQHAHPQGEKNTSSLSNGEDHQAAAECEENEASYWQEKVEDPNAREEQQGPVEEQVRIPESSQQLTSNGDETSITTVSWQEREEVRIHLEEALRKHRDSHYAMVESTTTSTAVVTAIRRWQDAGLPEWQLAAMLDEWDPDGHLHSRSQDAKVPDNANNGIAASTPVLVEEKVVYHIHIKKHVHKKHVQAAGAALTEPVKA